MDTHRCITLQSCVVYLSATELDDHEGLSNSLKLANQFKLVTGPSDVDAVVAFSFNRQVNTSSVDDGIRLASSCHSSCEAAGVSCADVCTQRVGDVVPVLHRSHERADEIGSDACIVTLHLSRSVRPRTDESNVLDTSGERQGAIVLQKDNSFHCGLVCKLLSLGSVDVAPVVPAIRLLFGRVKVSKTNGRYEYQDKDTYLMYSPNERRILTGQCIFELCFRDPRLVVGGWKPFTVKCTTVDIRTSHQGIRDGLLLSRSIVVRIIDIIWKNLSIDVALEIQKKTHPPRHNQK